MIQQQDDSEASRREKRRDLVRTGAQLCTSVLPRGNFSETIMELRNKARQHTSSSACIFQIGQNPVLFNTTVDRKNKAFSHLSINRLRNVNNRLQFLFISLQEILWQILKKLHKQISVISVVNITKTPKHTNPAVPVHITAGDIVAILKKLHKQEILWQILKSYIHKTNNTVTQERAVQLRSYPAGVLWQILKSKKQPNIARSPSSQSLTSSIICSKYNTVTQGTRCAAPVHIAAGVIVADIPNIARSPSSQSLTSSIICSKYNTVTQVTRCAVPVHITAGDITIKPLTRLGISAKYCQISVISVVNIVNNLLQFLFISLQEILWQILKKLHKQPNIARSPSSQSLTSSIICSKYNTVTQGTRCAAPILKKRYKQVDNNTADTARNINQILPDLCLLSRLPRRKSLAPSTIVTRVTHCAFPVHIVAGDITIKPLTRLGISAKYCQISVFSVVYLVVNNPLQTIKPLTRLRISAKYCQISVFSVGNIVNNLLQETLWQILKKRYKQVDNKTADKTWDINIPNIARSSSSQSLTSSITRSKYNTFLFISLQEILWQILKKLYKQPNIARSLSSQSFTSSSMTRSKYNTVTRVTHCAVLIHIAAGDIVADIEKAIQTAKYCQISVFSVVNIFRFISPQEILWQNLKKRYKQPNIARSPSSQSLTSSIICSMYNTFRFISPLEILWQILKKRYKQILKKRYKQVDNNTADTARNINQILPDLCLLSRLPRRKSLAPSTIETLWQILKKQYKQVDNKTADTARDINIPNIARSSSSQSFYPVEVVQSAQQQAGECECCMCHGSRRLLLQSLLSVCCDHSRWKWYSQHSSKRVSVSAACVTQVEVVQSAQQQAGECECCMCHGSRRLLLQSLLSVCCDHGRWKWYSQHSSKRVEVVQSAQQQAAECECCMCHGSRRLLLQSLLSVCCDHGRWKWYSQHSSKRVSVSAACVTVLGGCYCNRYSLCDVTTAGGSGTVSTAASGRGVCRSGISPLMPEPLSSFRVDLENSIQLHTILRVHMKVNYMWNEPSFTYW
ncbi:hypothetical protein J6590_062327 [Homalodisca vitripennis]|nr:hypothetical protein J6590_062327 [Homalodisca vitripennis]